MCRYGSRLPAIYRLRVYESADIGQCRVVEAIGLRTLDHSWRGGNIQTEITKTFHFLWKHTVLQVAELLRQKGKREGGQTGTWHILHDKKDLETMREGK